MPEVVTTDYNLIVQYDGYAVNKKAWSSTFLNYDYIGAVVLWFPPKMRVGNGGFSLRSQKLYKVMKAIDIKYRLKDLIKYKYFNRLDHILKNNTRFFKDKFTGLGIAEDIILSCLYRNQLEQEYNIKFAPEKIANKFSIESNLAFSGAYKSFGFHGPKLFGLYNSVFYSLLSENG